MGKFIKHIAIFLFTALSVLFIVEMFVRHIPNSYKHNLEILEQNSDSAEVVILGSSHAKQGINPKYFHQKAINMALDGQGIPIDAFILEKYADKLPNLKYIILPVDYQTLYMFDAYGSNDRYMYYNVYYGYEPNFFSIENYEIFHYKSIIQKISHYIQGKIHFCDDLGFDPVEEKCTDGAEWMLDYQTVPNLDKTSACNNDTIKKNIEALNRIAQFAQEKNLRLVIVTIPTHHSFYEKTDSTQELFTRREIDKIVAKSEKIMYFDYFEMPLDDNDFSDATHLNIYGAEKFSKVLANKLDSLELLNVKK